jgi:hypothetical protein
MITDQQYAEWLKEDTARRCLLIEVTPKIAGVDTTLRLATRPYVTEPTDTPANTPYLDVVQGGVKLNEQMSINGNASMSYGDIEIENNTGELDSWLDAIWVNREIVVYSGDVRWARADFREVFRGVVADIDSSGRNRLNIKLRDKLKRLDSAITETKLGGTTDNKDRLRPVLLGECHNFEPLLIDPATHDYQFHNGPSENVIEVRDNGVPVGFTPTLGAGTFRLSGTAFGTITVSAQGDNNGAYSNTVVGLIKKLVKTYGRVADRFSDEDLDLTSLTAFDAANPHPVGIWLPEKANVLATCQDLAASVGAMLMTTRLGKAKLVQINATLSATGAIPVGEDDMIQRTLKIAEKLEVSGAVKLGYCKNWTVQDKLESGIPEAHKDLFKKEWLEITRKDQTTLDDYKLHGEPDQEDTYLLTEAGAIAEADRRLGLRKKPRTVYQYQGFADSLTLQLGDVVLLTHSRYGLSGGKLGLVVKLEPDWLKSRCNVNVMI